MNNSNNFQEYDVCEFLGFKNHCSLKKEWDKQYYGIIVLFKRKEPGTQYYYELYTLKSSIKILLLSKDEFRKII